MGWPTSIVLMIEQGHKILLAMCLNEWMSFCVALPNEVGPIYCNGFHGGEHLKVPFVKLFPLSLLSDWPEAMHSPRNATWKVSKQGGLGKRNLISEQEAKFDLLMLEWCSGCQSLHPFLFRPYSSLFRHEKTSRFTIKNTRLKPESPVVWAFYPLQF